MGLSRERKIFVGVLGVAVAALVIDQGFLQPRSAGAAVPGPLTDGGAPAPEDGGPEGTQEGAEASPRRARSLTHIAARLRDAAGEGSGPGDAFALPVAWLEGEGSRDTGRVTQPEANSMFELSAVMPSPSGGVAVIDGNPIRVGQTVPGSGYRLISVTDGAAVIGSGSGTIRLTMPNEAYRPKSPTPKAEGTLTGFGRGSVER